MSSLALPLAAEELVPHRLPMRLVEQLLEIDGKNGIVAAQVAKDCPLVDPTGRLEDIALAELIAQGYATLKGYLDRLEKKPVRQGFLVGIKKIDWFGSVSVGEQLLIKIRTLAELDDFAVAEGEVWRGVELVASGEIKVWIN
jgi:predicted hotdog family 3-hydroxylacyl-ACP dehydratase